MPRSRRFTVVGIFGIGMYEYDRNYAYVHISDPAKLYFMSDLPAQVQWPDVLNVSLVAFMMCALATLYPAWRASRVQPAQALRHE